MNNRSLMIHEKSILYDILSEIKEQFEFSIIKFKDDDIKKLDQQYNSNQLVVSIKKIPNISNQIVLDKLPVNILSLIEKINIYFIKLNFHNQSKIKVGKYIFDLNAKEMKGQNQKLKLTEKEINFITYLFNIKKPVKVQELQFKVWGYQSELETHTVETHIYRLRKKILKKFNDNQFIKSTSSGYQVN